MSQFPELRAHLEKYPITNILERFRIDNEQIGLKYACGYLLSSLAVHMSFIINCDDIKQLKNDLVTLYTKLFTNQINIRELQPLTRSISENLAEMEIFDIAIRLARNLPSSSLLSPRSGRSNKSSTTTNEIFRRNLSGVISNDDSAPAVQEALKDELNGNAIIGFDNFWETFFLDKEWSDQTLRVWECYQSYETDQMRLQEEDDTASQPETHYRKIRKEKESQNNSSETRIHKIPKMFTELEVLEEGVALDLPEDFIGQQNIGKDQGVESKKRKTKENFIKSIDENKILVENMTENEIWDWLEFFQEKVLNQLTNASSNTSKLPSIKIEGQGFQLRNKYCRTTSHSQMIGTSNMCQVDFLIKNVEVPNNKIHQWDDVKVLGEFTIESSSKVRTEKFLKLSRFVLDVFSTQPLRQFVHGFCLFKTDFELWLFNRAGAYSSGLLTISENKDKLVRAITSYLLMSDEELGIYSPFQHINGRFSVALGDEKLDTVQEFDINPTPIFKAGRLVSRGTVCYEIMDRNAVVKYSWTRTAGRTEIDFMQDACETEGIVDYLRADKICKTSDHVKKLNFSSAKYLGLSGLGPISGSESVMRSTLIPCIKDREFTRLVVTPYGRRLSTSKTILEFLTGIRDGIKGHQRLFDKRKVLHGDISDGNIILASVEGRLQGFLIDLDHAVKVEETPEKYENGFLIGTMKFMALERLVHAAKLGQSIRRTYYHDLESFFYVFLTGCIEFQKRKKDEGEINLQQWCGKNVIINFKSKRSDMTFFRDILSKFSTNFEDLKDLASNLHNIFFGNGKIFEINEINFPTPDDHGPVYESMIKAFDEVISQIMCGRISNTNIKL